MTAFETLAADVDADLTHEHVTCSDVTLHVVTAGPTDGAPVVLLHGFPEFWYSWREQIPALADAGYHVIVPDLRGYNDSDTPRGVDQYTITHLTQDVVDLIEHYTDDTTEPSDDTAEPSDDPAEPSDDPAEAAAAGSAHVVGHDWGGGVAYALAIRHPTVVDHLTIMNAPHPQRFQELLRRPSQLRRSWYMFYFQLPHLPEYALTRNDAAILTDIFADSMPPSEIRHYRDAIQQPGAATAALNYYRATFRTTLHNALPITHNTHPTHDPTITAPTLLLWGDKDDALIPANTTHLDRWITTLTINHIPHATHWIQLDAPNRVNDALLTHLSTS